jgi:hypothetical protein
VLVCSRISCLSFDMEILSFGIGSVLRAQKTAQLTPPPASHLQPISTSSTAS